MKIDLYELMKERGYTYKTFSAEIKCSEGVLIKFFKDKKPIEFDIVLNIIRAILPEKEQEFMFNYCLISDKPNHLKCALEYADVHSNVELLGKLLATCEAQQNKEIREFGKIYRLLYDRLKEKKSNNDLFKQIECVHITSKELLVFRLLMEMNYYYYNKQFKQISYLIKEAGNSIDNLSKGFIKESYTVRFKQMLAYIELHLNCNPVKAREIAKQTIDTGCGNHINGFFYNIIATSFFNESKSEMNRYAEKSIKFYTGVLGNNHRVVADLSNRYRKLNMIMDEDFSQTFLEDKEDVLDLYIEGVKNQDMQTLIECLVELNKKGNLFFTEMTIKQLISLGCNKSLIDAIQSIN